MTPVAPVPTINPAVDARAALARLEAAVTRVVHGKPAVVRLALAALAARGHLLIEDVPGVGKTTLARALARAVGGTFRRIQFTSDLLPSDILGVSVFNQETGRFEFRRGPIFANVVLADEINRTTPRTQSSLLEAMSEGHVSIDTHTHELEQPFIVIATQNPLEHFGTYPLARVADGSLPPAPPHRLSVARGRAARGHRRAARGSRRGHRARRRSRATSPASRRRARASVSRRRCSTTPTASSAPRASRRSSRSASRRAAFRAGTAPPRRARSSPAATTPCPTTSRRPRSPRSRTAWSSPAARRASRSAARAKRPSAS